MNNLTPEEIKLLDQFAGEALNGIIANSTLATIERIVEVAYETAEAMLQERRKILKALKG